MMLPEPLSLDPRFCLIQVPDGNLRTGSNEALDNSKADAARPARHDGTAPFKIDFIHPFARREGGSLSDWKTFALIDPPGTEAIGVQAVGKLD
jgi:hypothetical protein